MKLKKELRYFIEKKKLENFKANSPFFILYEANQISYASNWNSFRLKKIELTKSIKIKNNIIILYPTNFKKNCNNNIIAELYNDHLKNYPIICYYNKNVYLPEQIQKINDSYIIQNFNYFLNRYRLFHSLLKIHAAKNL